MNFLLSHNIQLNSVNQEGETPLHVAVRAGFLEIVQKLMEQPVKYPEMPYEYP
jgi:ankyrin repeat protein